MQTDSIVMFRNQLEALCGLTSIKDVKLVVRAIIDYGMNGKTDIDMPDHLLFGWNAIKFQIDSVVAEQERKLESYRERGRMGALAKHSQAEAGTAKHSQAQPSIAKHSQAELGTSEQSMANGGYEYNNINNKYNITQERFLEKEKEKIQKEKKEIATPDDIFNEDTITLPDNYKRWSLDDFTASVDQVITSKPEYQEHREAFIRYWTEPDPKGKMRFSLQRTWLTAGRLATWAKNAGWGSSGNNNNNGNNNNGNNGYNKPGSEGSFGRYTPRNG